MTRQNPFDSKGIYSDYVNISYDLLMTREWITYNSIAEASNINISEGTKQWSCQDPKYQDKKPYIAMKKAFGDIRKAICLKLDKTAIEESGNNRNKKYRYVGKDNDPLADIKNKKVVKDFSEYLIFCQDMANIFPMSWLEFFFIDSRNLLNIKDKREESERIISASIDRILTNIDYLPLLYRAIKEKLILTINYGPTFKDCRTINFHPNYLKEHNGRWFLFGYNENQDKEYGFGFNIPLDRILSKPTIKDNQKDNEYKSAPTDYYDNFFKNIVGVSHAKDETPQTIHIRAHKSYMFKLTETKPIHHSQKVYKPFAEYEDGEYGEFTVYVELNNEFFGRILQMGADLEIVSPENVRELFKQRVEAMAAIYKDKAQILT